MTQPERSDSPHDRLTRICDVMTKALEDHPEHLQEDKAIVFLDDGQRGGIQIYGYEDDSEAMADLFIHLKAIFESNGKTLMFMPIGGDG